MNFKPGMLCWIDVPNGPAHGFVVTLVKYIGVKRFNKRDGSKDEGPSWEVSPPLPTWRRDAKYVLIKRLRPINPPPAPSKAHDTTKELETT